MVAPIDEGEQGTNMKAKSKVVMAGVMAAMIASGALAQDTGRPDYQNVNNNAHSGRVSARAPGNMVRAGLTRFSTFSQRAFAGTQITQDAASAPVDPWSQARIQSIQIMFTSVNVLINSFQNAIRAKAGLDPVPPTLPNFSGGTGGTGDTGGTGGTGDTGGTLGGLNINDLLNSLLGGSSG